MDQQEPAVTLPPSPVFGAGMNPLPPEYEAAGPARTGKPLLISLIVACALLLTGTTVLAVMLTQAESRAAMNGLQAEQNQRRIKDADKRISAARAEADTARDEASAARREVLEMHMKRLQTGECEIAAGVVKDAMTRGDRLYLDATLKQLAEKCKR
ncbi:MULTISPECIES: hypothetical protein [unclassified Crossiella]|uniref:hypothetical protein n=1 Tax=unclassified Crossiella TaxID=2620835 RepID=UPI001FFFBBAF|nr:MULTISPECIES: hypothetical protein [unclassified Crossiella]MCK2236722.1 hypothetical protein [Crossiella sp. S99.2]MCK2250390.1 hypothetical protein [Crossiella sp. S99.1]